MILSFGNFGRCRHHVRLDNYSICCSYGDKHLHLFWSHRILTSSFSVTAYVQSDMIFWFHTEFTAELLPFYFPDRNWHPECRCFAISFLFLQSCTSDPLRSSLFVLRDYIFSVYKCPAVMSASALAFGPSFSLAIWILVFILMIRLRITLAVGHFYFWIYLFLMTVLVFHLDLFLGSN